MNSSERPSRRFGAATILSLFAGLTTVAVLAHTWWTISQDRRLTLASEHANGVVAVRLLEEHAKQQLEAAALRMDAIAIGCANLGNGVPASDERIRELITTGLRNTRGAGALQFVNVRGERWASMIDFPAYVFPAEAREYVAQLLAQPANREIVVGHPFQRMIDGEQVLPLARNLFDRNGRHLGLISTELNLSYFDGVYARMAKDGGAVVQLFADAGFLIVRSPFDARAVNLDISATPLLRAVRSGPVEGAQEAASMLDDGKQRLFVYRRIDSFPLAIAFGRDLEVVLGSWRDRSRDRILGAGVFIVLHLILTHFLLLHMRRARSSEIRLRDSEAKFIELFQCSPVALSLMRIDNDELIEVNQAMLAQFGHTRAEFIGNSPQQLRMWLDPAERVPFLEALLREGRVDRFEARLRHKNGQVFVCLISSRVIDLNGQRVGIFSVSDISRQHQVEHEMNELNAALEQRVQERTINLEKALATVQAMQGELVRAEKMGALGALVTGIAHELNTPIGNSLTVASTLHTHAQSMAAELRSGRPQRSRLEHVIEMVEHGGELMVRNLQRAANLITSFKQVAGEQWGDRRSRFDLKQVIEEAARSASLLYRQRFSLQLELAPGLEMDSYPHALTQVLANFFSNSVHHGFVGRDDGTLRITSSGGQDDVEIVFSDDGCGVAPEHVGRVFDPFFTTTMGRGSSGLGMHIVYNLVTGTLGGNVALTSVAGGGTTLTLRLPRVAPS
jgi:PAS domain S-box-containing protein